MTVTEAIATRLPAKPTRRGPTKPTKPPRRPTKVRGELRRVVRLFVSFSGGRRLYLLALVMLVFEAITSVFAAYPLAFLIDFLRGDRPGFGIDVPFLTDPRNETVAVLTIGLILLTAFNSLADSMAEIYLARAGRILGYNTRESLHHKLQRLSLAFHDQRRTGDMLTRVTSDVTALEEFVVKSMGDLAGGILVLIGTLAFLIARSWQVAIVAVLIVPVMSVISNYFSERIKVASKRQRSHEGDLASSAQEMLTSIRVVQTYGRSGYEERRFGEQSRKSMEAALDTAVLQAKFSWVVSVLEALAVTLVVWIGLYLFDRGALTIGTLVLFVILIENMFKPTRKIIREWTRIGKIYAAVERIGEVLDRKPTVTDRPDAKEAPPFRGDLQFRDVTFSYKLDAEDVGEGQADSGRKVALDHVSFSAAPGEVVALIGHSGAGKSTTAQLIPRLYDPTEGTVLIDGTDIRTLTLSSLRSQIGVVLQDTVLFSGTVAENIAYGREDATREEVIEAARRANAHDFIAELPEGYDTMLGERAANLSGGQRQRIAIARAFIRGAPILILDEPTTGLDALATNQVVKGLRSLIEGKTTIIISHNLRLIRSADRVLVVEDGRIVQSGTHEELSSRPGAYAEFGILDAGGTPGDVADVADVVDLVDVEDVEELGPPAVNGAPVPHVEVDRSLEVHPAVTPNGSSTNGANGTVPPLAAKVAERDAPPPPADIDPLATPALQRALPGIVAGFDAEEMAARLQSALFGTAADAPVVESCEPGKAMYLGAEGCRVRYELTVRDPATGRHRQQLVLGRLLATAEEAATHRDSLEPLAAAVRGRDEVAGMARPTAVLADLAMVVHAFPIDGDLPALVPATDPTLMGPVLAEAIGREGATGGWRVETGHYGRRHRCVLRYERDAGRSPVPTVVYGKLCWDANGAQLVDGFVDLQADLARVGVRVPSLLAYRPELGLTLLSELRGAPLLDGLRRRRQLGAAEDEDPARLSGEVAAAGRVAAAVHRLPELWGRARPFAAEVAGLRKDLTGMGAISPGLAERLEGHLDTVVADAGDTDRRRAVLVQSHGDFTFSQLLDHGGQIGLLDFDSLCQAEPGLDLGQFVAYLRLSAAKAGQQEAPLVRELEQRFCSSYTDRRRVPADRVETYAALSLIRITVHAWQKLKPSRARLALSILEESELCH